jgi:2-(1,2-epoxy-1,2-dihydrophenyl)acetyl-CoA isomerase
MSDLLLRETHGPIAVLTLNRPESLNALGEPGDGEAIASVCAQLNADPAIRCAILTGAGKAFSAGGNVKAMAERTGAFAGSPFQVREGYRTNIHRLVRAFWGLEMPVISAVNGAAVGLGCDVACFGDIRIAASPARFGVTFLKLGIIPGDGGAWLLPRLIGHARASELLFTGRLIDAQTALSWGLISQVVAPEVLMDTAMTLAHEIAAQPPQALRLAKLLMRRGQTTDFDTVMDFSAAAQALMHHTADHMEGVSALLDKRAARFTGE